ncbi:Z-DNA-binding protein 1 isoform X2 [Myotis daubentonii]|uniref:Z-DNA-binding protein 1 isoform X2 n=1 Tax=Myotis daubentonii TaxID=98922 RepID=UPI002872B27E|nr:Z-DNA-binding protein 1 isoform X2 [Myotis daubentonii]
MAQASADIDETDLEQRILQVLKGAGTPVKAAQLAKECQVPRKDINRVLYRMKDKLQVDCDDSAKWRLREGGPGEMVPAEPAQPSHELQGQILRLLEASGPQRALSIARSLGMKTSKDVNRYLYAMQEKHLLDFDKNSKTWTIYQPERTPQPHLHPELRSRPDWTREHHRETNGPCGERLHGSLLPPSTTSSGSLGSGSPGWILGATGHPHRQFCAQIRAAGTRQQDERAQHPGHGPWPQPPSLCRHYWPRRNPNARTRTSPRGGGGRGPESPHQALLLGGGRHRQQQQPECLPSRGRGRARGQPRGPRGAGRGRGARVQSCGAQRQVPRWRWSC